MALFFDKVWFDSRLEAQGLSRAQMAEAAHISAQDLTLIFKDQMEVSALQTQAWADLLNESPQEIAIRCGISTPVRPPLTDQQRLAALEQRVTVLEAMLKQQGERFGD